MVLGCVTTLLRLSECTLSRMREPAWLHIIRVMQYNQVSLSDGCYHELCCILLKVRTASGLSQRLCTDVASAFRRKRVG
jgi:hypothetical protein